MAMAEAESPMIEPPAEVDNQKDEIIHLLSDLQPQLLDLLYNIQNERISDSLQKLEDQTGVYREQVVYFLLGITAVYLMIGDEAGLLCNLVGFMYPAFASFIAMEMDSRYDVFIWLFYWMCYGILSLVDFYADSIMAVLPVYWLFKTVLLLYLMLPQTNAIHNLYVTAVIPALTAFEEFILNYEVKADATRTDEIPHDVDV